MRDEILGVLEPIELTGLFGFRDHGKTKKLILPAKSSLAPYPAATMI
jgi:hypothetical protein